MDNAKITRYWLAKHAGVNITILGNYYKNKVIRYDSELLSRVCTVLDCDISDIIECVEVDEQP